MDKVLPIFCDFWFGHVDFINVVNARLLRMMRYCSLPNTVANIAVAEVMAEQCTEAKLTDQYQATATKLFSSSTCHSGGMYSTFSYKLQI
jgi:lipid A disaccharide synthetase